MKTRFSDGDSIPAVAAAAVQGGRAVRIQEGSADAKCRVAHAGAATDYVLGVARYDAEAGQEVALKRRGVVYLVASGAINADVDLVPAADGKVAAASGAAGERVFAHSLGSAGADGDLIAAVLKE